MTRAWIRLLIAGLLLSGLVWAQEENEDSSDASRGVARISLINGDASVRRGDSGDWVAAAVNGPMVDDDHLMTGPAARAEIQFDAANCLRLGTDTEVHLVSLEDNHYQVELFKGTVTLAAIRPSDAQVEVDTPNMAFRPSRLGSYRISVTDNRESEVTVRAGDGAVYTETGTQPLHEGQTMMLRGPESDPEFQIVQAIPVDGWDGWNQERDRQLLATRSYQYVSPEIDGAADLDSYGRWVYAQPYGWVWTPNDVGPDWAPYREGRWSWLDWYGWTWISYDPWGWAPYHYGRWFYQGGYGWCWFPGSVYGRHHWHPALVSFFGFGRGGAGFGFGSIGWVPLAPHERYYGWYGHGWYGFQDGRRFDSLRGMNVGDFRNGYRNARMGNGISGMEAGVFARGGRPGALRLDGQERVSLVRGALPVAPSAASLRMSNRQTRFAPSVSSRSQRFFSTRPARAQQRIPFSAQRQGAERYAQRAFDGPGGRGAAQSPAAPRAWRQAGDPPRSPGNWRQYGQPASRAQTQTQAGQGSPNWRNDGRPAQPQARPQKSNPRYQAPRVQRTVRINPPIVRERTSTGGGGGWRGGGGGSSRGGGSSSSRGGGGGGGRSGSGHGGGGGGGHSHGR